MNNKYNLSCVTCDFFHKYGTREFKNIIDGKLTEEVVVVEKYGACRIRPPICLKNGKAKWPAVTENDWCGSHPEHPKNIKCLELKDSYGRASS